MRQTKQEAEETQLNISLAGEVYYFIAVTFISVFAICSMLSNSMSVTECAGLIVTMIVLPFIVIAIFNFIKVIFIKTIAAQHGKKE